MARLAHRNSFSGNTVYSTYRDLSLQREKHVKFHLKYKFSISLEIFEDLISIV